MLPAPTNEICDKNDQGPSQEEPEEMAVDLTGRKVSSGTEGSYILLIRFISRVMANAYPRLTRMST